MAKQAAEAAPMVEVRTRVDRDILRVPKREGFVRRLVKNDASRIEEMEDLGYKVVKSPEGGPLTRREFIVVETPKDLYDTRQMAKVRDIKSQRRALQATARRDLEAQARDGRMRGKAQIIGDIQIEGE